MRKLFIGIASQQTIRTRVLAIARGDHQPPPNEPKIWFTSMPRCYPTTTAPCCV